MSVIQLSPNLHNTVHTLKCVELQGNERSLIKVVSVSTRESFAINRTFNRSVNNRQNDLTQIAGDWA